MAERGGVKLGGWQGWAGFEGESWFAGGILRRFAVA